MSMSLPLPGARQSRRPPHGARGYSCRRHGRGVERQARLAARGSPWDVAGNHEHYGKPASTRPPYGREHRGARIRDVGLRLPHGKLAALDDWIFSADPVLAWLHDRVEWDAGAKLPLHAAHQDFRSWARLESFREQRLSTTNPFVQRLQAKTIACMAHETRSLVSASSMLR